MRKTAWILIIMYIVGMTIGMPAIYAGSTSTEKLHPNGKQYSDGDIFAPFIDDAAPKIVNNMGNTVEEGIEIREFTFRSLIVNGQNQDVYSIVGIPENAVNAPGLIWFHGGKGKADKGTVVKWAKRGYVAMVMDIPGIADPERCPNSTGPWTSQPYDTGKWNAAPDAKASVVFDAVVAGLQSYNLLRSLKEVDPECIGITGSSWGGYMATMISGLLGDRVKATYSKFGSGFYDKENTAFASQIEKLPAEQKETWLKYLDAGRRAKNIKSPFFIAAAARDNYFSPPAVTATLNEISSEKYYFFAPEKSHSLDGVPGGDQVEKRFFDYYLKHEGTRLPVINLKSAVAEKDGSKTIEFTVDSEDNINFSGVFYCRRQGNIKWQERVWEYTEATDAGNKSYTASIPKPQEGEDTDWYILISDSVASPVGSLIYNFSDTIKDGAVVNKDTDKVESDEDKKTGVTFNDIKGHWAENDIQYLAEKEIVKGITETDFAPENVITRAEFLTLILRITDIKPVAYVSAFNDVTSDKWYANAIQAAHDTGLIPKGMSDNESFRPEEYIDRESMAALSVSAYYYKGNQSPGTNVSAFDDRDKISPWALKYIQDAVELGIVKGVTENRFDPASNATRAQAAVIIKRIMNKLNQE